MSGLTVIFHVASALGLIVLLAVVVRMEKERDFVRFVLRVAVRRQGAKIVVDQPARFLASLASACGARFEVEGGTLEALLKAPPKRLDSQRLIDFFVACGVSLVRWKVSPSASKESSSAPVVTFTLARPATEPPSVVESELAAALGGSVTCALST